MGLHGSAGSWHPQQGTALMCDSPGFITPEGGSSEVCSTFSQRSLKGSPHSCPEWEPAHSHISSPNARWVSWDYFLNKLVALKSLIQNLLWWEPTLSKMQGLQNFFSICERIPSSSQIPLQLLPPGSATLDPNIPQNVACPCLSKTTMTPVANPRLVYIQHASVQLSPW